MLNWIQLGNNQDRTRAAGGDNDNHSRRDQSLVVELHSYGMPVPSSVGLVCSTLYQNDWWCDRHPGPRLTSASVRQWRCQDAQQLDWFVGPSIHLTVQHWQIYVMTLVLVFKLLKRYFEYLPSYFSICNKSYLSCPYVTHTCYIYHMPTYHTYPFPLAQVNCSFKQPWMGVTWSRVGKILCTARFVLYMYAHHISLSFWGYSVSYSSCTLPSSLAQGESPDFTSMF